MSNNYNDNVGRAVPCLIDAGTLCMHSDCVQADLPVCGKLRPLSMHVFNTTCLKPAEHDLDHRNGNITWSNSSHRASKAPEPHTCPEPELLVVSESMVKSLQQFLDEIGASISAAGHTKYEVLRFIIDRMEKGFRIP